MTLLQRAGGCLANSALLSFGLLLALIIGEVAVRQFAPQQLVQVRPDIWVPADSLGWANGPNVRTTINTGERTVHLYTDANGLRVGVRGRVDAPIRVLLIGDSFAEALQVEYEQSFAGLLEADLTSRLRRTVSVWNAGVDGWDPPQYLIRARQLLRQNSFDLVIVALYLGNDVVRRRVDYFAPRTPTVFHRLHLPRRVSWNEFVDACLWPLNDVAERHSQLYVLFRSRLHVLLMRLRLTGENFPEELRKDQATSSRWDVTADVCRDVAAAAREDGIPTLFVLLPSPFAVDTTAFRQAQKGFGLDSAALDLDQPDRLMGATLQARSLRVLQVQTAFRRLNRPGAELYGRVDRHLTPLGNQELERLVLPVAESLLVRAPAGGWRPAHRRR